MSDQLPYYKIEAMIKERQLIEMYIAANLLHLTNQEARQLIKYGALRAVSYRGRLYIYTSEIKRYKEKRER